MNRSDPTYVTGTKLADGSIGPPYRIQPPIDHPAFCVCRRCSDLPAEERSKPHSFRTLRASLFPTSYSQTAVFAIDTKRKIERELRESSAKAIAEGSAPAATFGDLCRAYRAHQRKEGKRLDRNEYVIAALEKHFGSDTKAADISKASYRAFVAEEEKKELSGETIGRHTRILLAILNSGVRDGMIISHQLHGIRRPIVRRRRKPVIFTQRQVAVLLGPAMDLYEAWQAEAAASYPAGSNRVPPSVVPLRGFCLIAFLALVRPGNNFGLLWEELHIHPTEDRGSFHVENHKNVSRGVELEGPLHPRLVRYLRTIPASRWPRGLVHPNPATGAPYRNIRAQWHRLIEIANTATDAAGQPYLDASERISGVRRKFYTWRHTGASLWAKESRDPVMIVRMMGDTDLETVKNHYFDSYLSDMQSVAASFDVPTLQESVLIAPLIAPRS